MADDNEEGIKASEIVSICSLALIFIFSLFGQFLILYVLTANNRARLSLPLYRFLLNINITSLVGILTLPFHLMEELFTSWPLGRVTCKLIEFVEHSTLAVVLMTHLLISLDRYYIVVKAMTGKLSLKKSNLLILGTWVLAAVVFSPDLYVYDSFQFNDHESCTSNPERLGKANIVLRVLKVVFLFTIPFVFICVTNFRVVRSLHNLNQAEQSTQAAPIDGPSTIEQQPDPTNIRQRSLSKAIARTTKMTACLATLFLLGSTPSFVICQTYASSEFIKESHRQTTAYQVATMAMFLSAALMPVIFAIFDKNIKNALKYIFCRKRNVVHVNNQGNE